MLKGKDISNDFWAEALNTAVYFKNRSPTRSLEFKSPFEELYGFKPVVKHLRVFGSKEFAHIPKEERRKLDSKAIKCTFVGYCSQFKAYRLFNPSTHKIFVLSIYRERRKRTHSVDFFVFRLSNYYR